MGEDNAMRRIHRGGLPCQDGGAGAEGGVLGGGEEVEGPLKSPRYVGHALQS